MAGLLDSFFGNSFEDPKSQAVMALAGGLLSNDWKKGLNGYMQTMAAVPEANYEKAVRKAKLDELNAQAGLKQEQIRQSMAKAENEKRIRELVAGAGRAKMGMGAPSLLNESLPEDMRVGAMPQAQGDGFDFQSLYQQGVPFEVLKDLAATRNLGREEVARVQDIEGQGGAKILQGFDKYGRPVGQGATGYMPPQLVNQGDRQSFVKPVAGLSLPMGQSPDNKASNALGWANHNISKSNLDLSRERMDRELTKQGKGAPMSVTLQKELLESDDVAQSSKAIIDTLNQAKKINTDAYSGYAAKGRAVLASNIPGFSSKSADATIDLDNMVTGQALESLKSLFGGMPTEGERRILLDMQASADKTPAQREAIMDRAIKAAERRGSFANKKAGAIRGGTYLTDGVVDSPTNEPSNVKNVPARPMKGMVISGYKFKGGDPADQANWEKQ